MKPEIENEELLQKIRESKTSRDQIARFIYNDTDLLNAFHKISILKELSDHEVKTIFNEAILLFLSTVVKRKDFVISISWRNYMVAIWKNLALKLLKERKPNISMSEIEISIPDNERPEELIFNSEKRNILNTLLNRLGKNCREVLLYWANGYSMEEIATAMKYQSDMMARKKKYQCMNELMSIVSENPAIKSALR